MATPKPSTILAPAAGLLVYKAFKSGKLDFLKDGSLNQTETSESADISDYIHNPAGVSIPDGSRIEINRADTIHGEPAQNIEFDPNVYQFYEDTCAIQSQHLILEQYGIHVSQEELIEIAKTNGWYAEGYGTPMDMVGKLLEYYGVDIHGSTGNNIFNLVNELAQGHQVIVGVDAYELVYPEETSDWDLLYGEQANHALVVVGIDTSDPDNVQVIVTDPGTGNRQMAYPAEQFMDAWKDSNCFMVSTDTVPLNPMHDYTPLDNFAGIPIDSIERLSGMDIDLSNQGEYRLFFDDLLSHPDSLDNLLDVYSDLFDDSTDELDVIG